MSTRYPQAYLEYLVHFHSTRDFFECHEVMEEYWKEHPQDPFHRTYVGLIQLAVAVYHQRRGNTAGAVKMLESSIANMRDDHLEALGLHASELRKLQSARLKQIRDRAAYEDMNLPLADPELIRQCKELSDSMQAVWGSPSRMHDAYLIDKHRLRDRSDVIAERERQKQLRQRNRK